jgi:CHASE1-domain containing sensor protein
MDMSPKNKTKSTFSPFNFYGFFLGLAIVMISLSFSRVINDIVENQINAELSNAASQIVNDVETNVRLFENILSSGAGLYASSVEVTREEWNQFVEVQDILNKYPEIKALEYIERVGADEKMTFIEGVRAEGFEDFRIKPSQEKEEYFVVNFVEPIEGNEAAFGFDLSSNPDRLKALELSRDKNDFIITAPIQLVQNDLATPAFLGMIPVYDNAHEIDALEARRAYLQGFVLAVFEAEDVLSGVAENATLLGINFSLVDLDSGESLYDSDGEGNDYPYSDGGTLEITVNKEVGSRVWAFSFRPNSIFLDRFQNDVLLPKIILGGGIFVALMVLVVFYLIDRARRIAVEVSDQMTLNFNEEQKKVLEQKDSVEKALEEAKQARKTAEEKANQVEKLNEAMVGRELRLVEMKKEMEELEEDHGDPK